MTTYKINLLALPKLPAMMKCFIAEDGCTLCQFDLTAIEPHVLTHLSKDPTLTKIYGDGASPYHDIYFAAGMGIPGIGERIKEHYDLDNPTKDGVAHLKKTMGDIRSKILKPSYLGWCYGLGAATMSASLDISMTEARKILDGLDRQFKGKKWLHEFLIKKWAENGGFVINGRGMPVCLGKSKLKDIVNRVVQSTGHDILIRILHHFRMYVIDNNLNIMPYIADYHDETIWQAPEGFEYQFTEATEYAFIKINEELNWDGVKIRHGGINFGKTLEVRCE